MKTRKIQSLVLVALLAQPLLSSAQSAEEDCDKVRQAAQYGLEQANTRIAKSEANSNQQSAARRQCMEQFSDIASRQTMVIGGFDLSPLRAKLLDAACDAVDKGAAKITTVTQESLDAAKNQINAQIKQSGVSSMGVPGFGGGNAGKTEERSIFSRLSCSLRGDC